MSTREIIKGRLAVLKEAREKYKKRSYGVVQLAVHLEDYIALQTINTNILLLEGILDQDRMESKGLLIVLDKEKSDDRDTDSV